MYKANSLVIILVALAMTVMVPSLSGISGQQAKGLLTVSQERTEYMTAQVPRTEAQEEPAISIILILQVMVTVEMVVRPHILAIPMVARVATLMRITSTRLVMVMAVKEGLLLTGR